MNALAAPFIGACALAILWLLMMRRRRATAV
jgi:hypothetical protein